MGKGDVCLTWFDRGSNIDPGFNIKGVFGLVGVLGQNKGSGLGWFMDWI